MRTVDLLHELQEVDRQLESTRAALDQAARTLGDRSALDRLTQEIEQKRAELQRLEAAERDLELDAEGRRTKITADERKLYSGSIHSPKELEALSQEVAQEKRQLDAIETRLLELLDQSEEARAALTAASARLEREAQAWTASQARTKQRVEALEQSARDQSARREKLAAQIESSARAHYENLRRQKGGLAVALVLQGNCQACRVAVSPALVQRARQGVDLVPCPSCGRILYIPL